MKVTLKSLDMNSAVGFDTYRPADPHCFGVWLTAGVGEAESSGADDFQILVCNEKWLQQQLTDGRISRRLVIEGEWNARHIRKVISRQIEACTGDTWNELLQQLSKFAEWEYEGHIGPVT